MAYGAMGLSVWAMEHQCHGIAGQCLWWFGELSKRGRSGGRQTTTFHRFETRMFAISPSLPPHSIREKYDRKVRGIR